MSADTLAWIILGCLAGITTIRTAWRHARQNLLHDAGLWFR
jgi:hypothetical protein